MTSKLVRVTGKEAFLHCCLLVRIPFGMVEVCDINIYRKKVTVEVAEK
jgi:hypothetical protein